MKLFKTPKPLALIITNTPWTEVPRSRHQFSNELSKNYNVLYLDIQMSKVTAAKTEISFVNESICVVVFSIFSNFNYRFYANSQIYHAFKNFYLSSYVKKFLKANSLNKINLCCTFLPDSCKIVKSLQAERSFYFCVDDFVRMWRQQSRPNFLKYYYQRYWNLRREISLLKEVDFVLSSHLPLVHRHKRYNKKSYLFTHGHNLQIDNNISNVEPITDKNNKILNVCFMGFLTYNLLNDWLLLLLKDPKICLHLIGPIDNRHFSIRNYIHHNNFVYHGVLIGNELQSTLRQMDVFVMPYNPLIPEVEVQTISNKFYNYIATCRPVVISDMRYYKEFPHGVIYRSRTADEFKSQIFKAFEEDCEGMRLERLRIANENSWSNRMTEFYKILNIDN
jgi:hypothetical protein